MRRVEVELLKSTDTRLSLRIRDNGARAKYVFGFSFSDHGSKPWTFAIAHSARHSQWPRDSGGAASPSGAARPIPVGPEFAERRPSIPQADLRSTAAATDFIAILSSRSFSLVALLPMLLSL